MPNLAKYKFTTSDGILLTAIVDLVFVIVFSRVRNDLNGHGVKINGFDDIPRPFLIGVGGGTASGKVGPVFFLLYLFYVSEKFT